ncbi:MAG: PIN domain-containing protein [Parachlamydiaceae bacterium]|nr:PIN domain-containing protein [Parachlamydiaceae bacterium]
MGLIQDIGQGPICLDTVIFIYFMEEHEKYLPLIEPIFEAIDKGHFKAYTSGITLLETLVVPLRAQDNELVNQYSYLLMESHGLKMLDLDWKLLHQAAWLRAKLGIKTPDALQLAAALISKCTSFITNDRRMPNLANVRVLQLSDYLR